MSQGEEERPVLPSGEHEGPGASVRTGHSWLTDHCFIYTQLGGTHSMVTSLVPTTEKVTQERFLLKTSSGP